MILLVDVQKGDLVDHNTLLTILEELEIYGISLQLIKPYLSYRRVVTRIDI